jgi:hypothetical protein
VSDLLIRATVTRLAPLCGLPVTLTVGRVVHLGRHRPWVDAVATGLAAGLVCGLLLAAVLRQQFARTRELYDSLPPGEDRKVLLRGTARGPLPTDPQTRAAMAQLVDSQLQRLERKRMAGLFLSLLLGAGAVWLALERNPLWWLAAVFFASGVGSAPLATRALRRRARLLRGPSDGE